MEKNETLAKERRCHKWYLKKAIENHYVIVGEPRSHCVSHVTVCPSKGTSIAQSIKNQLMKSLVQNFLLLLGLTAPQLTPVGKMELFQLRRN